MAREIDRVIRNTHGRERFGVARRKVWAVIVQSRDHTRVARIRADGTADVHTEELVLTSDVIEIKPTHVVPTAQRGTVTLPAEVRRNLEIEEETPLQIIEEDGWFSVRPLNRLRAASPEVELNELLSRITPENLHGEVSAGDAAGREAW